MYLDGPPVRFSRNVPVYVPIILCRCDWWWRISVLVWPCDGCAGEAKNVPVTSFTSAGVFFLVDVLDAGNKTLALNALFVGLAVGPWSSLTALSHCKHCGSQEPRTYFRYSSRICKFDQTHIKKNQWSMKCEDREDRQKKPQTKTRPMCVFVGWSNTYPLILEAMETEDECSL